MAITASWPGVKMKWLEAQTGPPAPSPWLPWHLRVEAATNGPGGLSYSLKERD